MLKIVYKSNSKPLLLKPKDTPKSISGTSANKLYVDENGIEYYLKKPKPRKPRQIFKGDFFFNSLIKERATLLNNVSFNPYTEEPEEDTETQAQILALPFETHERYEKLKSSIAKYVAHVQELMLTNFIIELIAPRICGAIMGNMMVIPENYLAMIEDSPLLVSRSVGHLHEFLSSHLLIEGTKTPDYWLTHERPHFKDLELSIKEARILGQAYFVALLMGNNDLVSNINLSNVGYVLDEHGSFKLCIVDWGNVMGIGFSGFTTEESAFLNSQFKEDGLSDSLFCEPADIQGFKHTMPFDEVVYPMLPRQVIPDLFDLTSLDAPELRLAQRYGFYEACDQAVGIVGHLEELISPIIHNTLYKEIPFDPVLIRHLLPDSTYSMRPGTSSYNLPTVLEGRIKSLQQMKRAIQDGLALSEITETRLSTIRLSQTYPKKFFSPKIVIDKAQTPSPPTCNPSQPINN